MALLASPDDVVALRIALLDGLRVEAGGRVFSDDAWACHKAAGLLKLLALTPATACNATSGHT